MEGGRGNGDYSVTLLGKGVLSMSLGSGPGLFHRNGLNDENQDGSCCPIVQSGH